MPRLILKARDIKRPGSRGGHYRTTAGGKITYKLVQGGTFHPRKRGDGQPDVRSPRAGDFFRHPSGQVALALEDHPTSGAHPILDYQDERAARPAGITAPELAADTGPRGAAPPAPPWTCKRCGTANPHNASECDHCGARGFPDQPAAPSERWRCDNCTQLNDGGETCRSCWSKRAEMTDGRAHTGVIAKAGTGEGSRGGHVIGRTRSGKAIYFSADHPKHADFSHADHGDAIEAHADAGVSNQGDHRHYYEIKKHRAAQDRMRAERSADPAAEQLRQEVHARADRIEDAEHQGEEDPPIQGLRPGGESAAAAHYERWKATRRGEQGPFAKARALVAGVASRVVFGHADATGTADAELLKAAKSAKPLIGREAFQAPKQPYDGEHELGKTSKGKPIYTSGAHASEYDDDEHREAAGRHRMAHLRHQTAAELHGKMAEKDDDWRRSEEHRKEAERHKKLAEHHLELTRDHLVAGGHGGAVDIGIGEDGKPTQGEIVPYTDEERGAAKEAFGKRSFHSHPGGLTDRDRAAYLEP